MTLNIPHNLLMKSMGLPNSCIVTVSIPENIAKSLYLDGGLSTDEFHITLAYITDIEDLTSVSTVVSNVCTTVSPISIDVGNYVGRFSGEDADVLYAPVFSEDLREFRKLLTTSLTDTGIIYSTKHEWTPHITLSYVDFNIQTPMVTRQEVTWVAEFIEVWNNGVRFYYPLANVQDK